MKKMRAFFFIFILILIVSGDLVAQCAMCTKTAQQLGEKPAQGMNSGILYLMFTPFVIVGFIAYRWWKGRIPDEESTGQL